MGVQNFAVFYLPNNKVRVVNVGSLYLFPEMLEDLKNLPLLYEELLDIPVHSPSEENVTISVYDALSELHLYNVSELKKILDEITINGWVTLSKFLRLVGDGLECFGCLMAAMLEPPPVDIRIVPETAIEFDYNNHKVCIDGMWYTYEWIVEYGSLRFGESNEEGGGEGG